MSEKLFSIYDIYISCFIYFIYIYADHAAGVITNIMSKNSVKLCLFVILFEKILGKSEQILQSHSKLVKRQENS